MQTRIERSLLSEASYQDKAVYKSRSVRRFNCQLYIFEPYRSVIMNTRDHNAAPSSNAAPMEEVQTIVRRFSGQVGSVMPENQVAQAVTQVETKVQRKENVAKTWRMILAGKTPRSEDPTFAKLDDATQEMIQAWKEFQGQLPTGEQLIWGQEPPSLVTVESAIQKWSQRYDKKNEPDYEKTKTTFDDVCKTLDSYSGLFQFFPSGDKYASAICGTISLIVQASVNHSKISKEFASSLVTIGKETKFWYKQLVQFESPEKALLCNLAELYVQIFQFLGLFMKWKTSRGKRVWYSLDKHFLDESIRGPIDAILAFSEEIRREAEYQSREMMKNMGKTLDNMNEIQKKQLEQLEYLTERHKEQEKQRREGLFDSSSGIKEKIRSLELVGGHGILFLESHAIHILYDERSFSTAGLQSPQRLMIEDTESDSSKIAQLTNEVIVFERSRLQANSAHLLDDAQYGFPSNFLHNIQKQKTAGKIFLRMQAWMSAVDSITLWVRGPGHTSQPSETSLIALYIVSIAAGAHIPLVAHCCQRDDLDDLRQDIARITQTQALVRMIYSLVRQLTWQAPDRFETQLDFSHERFQALDGSVASLPASLALFRDLLDAVPRLLFCVIDGLQVLNGVEEESDGEEEEDEHKDLYLLQFLEILQEYREKKVLKVLFTTNGFCDVLNRLLEEEEKVNCIETARRRLGKGAVQGDKQLLSKIVPEEWKVEENFADRNEVEGREPA